MLMLLIGFYVIFLIMFLGSFLFSKSNYKKRFKMDYSIRNTFPYELNYESRFTDNILGNSFLVLSLCFLIAFYLTANTQIKNPILIILCAVGCINTILIGVSHFVSLKFLKTHMIFSIFLFLTSFLLPGLMAVCIFPYYQDFLDPYYLILFIICCVVALFYFGVTMNPKLSLNIKMDVIKDENNVEKYVRPKFITYALSEWLCIFGSTITPIFIILLLVSQL